jgi:hypothetical protein
MATIKTVVTDDSVTDFIDAIEDETKRQDAQQLLKIFESITKEKPKLWSSNIIGFGQYHYKSERSAQEGEWMLTGFSPRKQNLSIYIMPGFSDYSNLLSKLGKHKISGGSCLYINKLTDIDSEILEKLIKQSFEDMKKKNNID